MNNSYHFSPWLRALCKRRIALGCAIVASAVIVVIGLRGSPVKSGIPDTNAVVRLVKLWHVAHLSMPPSRVEIVMSSTNQWDVYTGPLQMERHFKIDPIKLKINYASGLSD